MSAPYYRVNNVDFVPYLKDGGFEYSEEDIDADGAGRTLNGLMQRAKICDKKTHKLTCRPLTTAESNTVLQALSSGQYVTVSTNIHPRSGTFSGTMYNSKRTAAVLRLDEDGTAWWTNITFSLIEQ